jgi:hypothetical protein
VRTCARPARPVLHRVSLSVHATTGAHARKRSKRAAGNCSRLFIHPTYRLAELAGQPCPLPMITAGERHAATARRRRTRQHVRDEISCETYGWMICRAHGRMHIPIERRTLRGGSVCWCCRHASCSMCAETCPATIQKPETAKTVGNDANARYSTRPCRRAAHRSYYSHLASSKSRASKPQGAECDDR